MPARLYQLILSIRLAFYRLLRFTSALLESRMHHFRRRREGTEFEERHSFEVRRPRPSRTGSGRPQWRRRSAVMADRHRQRLKSQTFVAKTIPYCVCHAVRTTTSSENYPTLFAPRARGLSIRGEARVGVTKGTFLRFMSRRPPPLPFRLDRLRLFF